MSDMANRKFGQRLAEIRKRKGFTQESLAEALGVHWTHIAKIESGVRNPSLPLLLKIAEILDVSLDELFGFEKKSDAEKEVSNFQVIREQDYKVIPVYNGAHAGNEGSYPDGSVIIDYALIPKDMPGLFAVKVVGDSMEPEIYEGDYVVVNPNLTVNNNDKVVVILGEPYFHEPSAVVKIYKVSGNVRYLQSKNEKYDPIILDDDVEVHFVGKVEGLVRRY